MMQTYDTTTVKDHLEEEDQSLGFTARKGSIERTILSESMIVCSLCATVMTVTSLPSSFLRDDWMIESVL